MISLFSQVALAGAHVSAPHRNSPLLSKPADQKVKPLLTVTTDDVDGMVFL